MRCDCLFKDFSARPVVEADTALHGDPNHVAAVRLVGLREIVYLGHFLGAVKALAAFAAAIGTVGKKEEDPEFQDASALGSMHMLTAA